MPLTPTLRTIALALLVFLGTAVVWWLVGFQIGKGFLEEAGGGGAAWRALFGFRDGGTARLLFLALLAVLSGAVAAAAQGTARWPILAALALGAALVLGVREGALAAIVLFVLAAGAVGEANGSAQIAAAAVLALVIALVEALDVNFTMGEGTIAVLLRGPLFWLPLLIGPPLAERFVLDRAR